MPCCCTKCDHTHKNSFFQPRLPTTDKNRLLQTCSICREQRCHSHNAWKYRVPLAELNINKITIGSRSQENNNNILLSSVRQHYNVSLSNDFSSGLPSPGHPLSNLPFNLILPNILPRRQCRLSFDLNDSSFQRKHGFADCIKLNKNSILFAFVYLANQIHRTR